MLLRWTPPLLLVALLALIGCGGGDETPLGELPTGIVTAESRFDYAPTVRRLDSLLQWKPAIRVAARIDHAANADSVGLSLRPTYVTLFGSPELGAPLMQATPQAGLDLPQHALVYETPDGRAMLLYNSVAYLVQRHGLGDVATLRPMRVALQSVAETVTDSTVTPDDSTTVDEGAGIITVESDASVYASVDRLRAAIKRNEALSVMAEVDHAANAASVGMELPPARLIVFGNPTLGTPLMQDAPTLALDLPQKMLVYEDDEGTVHVAYNDPFFLAERHVLSGQEHRLQTIADVLAGLAAQAAGDS
jgi:uncharacterized protein (DUF302 family)